jgi:carboxylesterase type B
MQQQSAIPDYEVNLTVSEDCLVLNIWTTNVVNTTDNNSSIVSLKPVMFWIYGGGLNFGSIYQIPPYNGSALAAHEVVLVAANYRLGPFGFLYGDRDDCPGNQGFYDQLLALKWVLIIAVFYYN